jgi:ABC-type multidrug transport system fused ATPase/permease subunit
MSSQLWFRRGILDAKSCKLQFKKYGKKLGAPWEEVFQNVKAETLSAEFKQYLSGLRSVFGNDAPNYGLQLTVLDGPTSFHERSLQKISIVIMLALLIIIGMALLLFIAAMIATFVFILIYSVSMPIALKIGLVVLLIVSVITELSVWRFIADITAYCECGTCVAIRKQQGRG